jgi:hypothetical protein
MIWRTSIQSVLLWRRFSIGFSWQILDTASENRIGYPINRVKHNLSTPKSGKNVSLGYIMPAF